MKFTKTVLSMSFFALFMGSLSMADTVRPEVKGFKEIFDAASSPSLAKSLDALTLDKTWVCTSELTNYASGHFKLKFKHSSTGVVTNSKESGTFVKEISFDEKKGWHGKGYPNFGNFEALISFRTAGNGNLVFESRKAVAANEKVLLPSSVDSSMEAYEYGVCVPKKKWYQIFSK